MTGAWEDRDGDSVHLMWTSSLDGPLFIGPSWDPIPSVGRHILSLQGSDDNGGVCSDEVEVTVGL